MHQITISRTETGFRAGFRYEPREGLEIPGHLDERDSVAHLVAGPLSSLTGTDLDRAASKVPLDHGIVHPVEGAQARSAWLTIALASRAKERLFTDHGARQIVRRATERAGRTDGLEELWRELPDDADPDALERALDRIIDQLGREGR